MEQEIAEKKERAFEVRVRVNGARVQIQFVSMDEVVKGPALELTPKEARRVAQALRDCSDRAWMIATKKEPKKACVVAEEGAPGGAGG